jgi:uncharacterized membrane protein YfcA
MNRLQKGLLGFAAGAAIGAAGGTRLAHNVMADSRLERETREAACTEPLGAAATSGAVSVSLCLEKVAEDSKEQRPPPPEVAVVFLTAVVGGIAGASAGLGVDNYQKRRIQMAPGQ